MTLLIAHLFLTVNDNHASMLFCIGNLPAISQHQWTTEAKERLLLKGTISPSSGPGPQTAKPTVLSTSPDVLHITGFGKQFNACPQTSCRLERSYGVQYLLASSFGIPPQATHVCSFSGQVRKEN